METWKDVVGYEGLYEVSDAGRIRNARTGKIKTYTHNRQKRRPFVGLWQKNKLIQIISSKYI